MKKKTFIILACLLMIIALLSGIGTAIISKIAPDSNCRFYFTDDITLNNGQLTVNGEAAAYHDIPFELNNEADVDYTLHVKWTSENPGTPGFLTAMVLLDAGFNPITYVTGDYADSRLKVTLAPGSYTARYCFFKDPLEFAKFLAANSGEIMESETSFDGYSSFGANGTFSLKFSFELVDDAQYNSGLSVGVLIGVAIGVLVVIIVLTATKKNDTLRSQFDERQELVRGKGFKYGFFTMMSCNGIAAILTLFPNSVPMDTPCMIALSLFAGIVVFACYCIWNDGYFSLNENRKSIMIFLVFVGILNLVIGIRNVLSGDAIQDGRLTFEGLNLMCGAVFIIIFAVFVAKAIRDRKEE